MSDAGNEAPPPIHDEGTVAVRADFTYERESWDRVRATRSGATNGGCARALTGSRRVTYDRFIDKDGDLYHERVVDVETGEVVRDVTEPLSDHRGRGSAKPEKA